MKLSELFGKDNIVLDLPSGAKEEVLEAILRNLDERNQIQDFDRVMADLLEREKVMSTGIGHGVAIPHAYTDGVDRLVAGFFRTSEGVDFEALDEKKVDLFFIILGPKESRRDHIKLLAKVSRLLNHEDFREELRKAGDREEVYSIIKKYGDK